MNVSNYIPFNSGKQRLVKLVQQRIVVEQLPSTLNPQLWEAKISQIGGAKNSQNGGAITLLVTPI